MDIDTHLVPFLSRSHGLVLHVALALPPLAAAVRKGGALHRRSGRAYMIVLFLQLICAAGIGLAKPEDFWYAALAFLAFHTAASGYRSLYLKRLHQGQRPSYVDLVLHAGGAAFHGGLLIWGISHFALGEKTFMARLFLLVGLVGTLNGAFNFLQFHKSQHDKREWLFGHIAGMIGSYIVVLCTWSALHLEMLKPLWLQWGWPALLGLPLIVLLVRWYKQRFLKGVRIRDIADVRIR
ncbi:MAG TPA: hypothetical protein VGE21_14775 [Flavobacteriales bacterium]